MSLFGRVSSGQFGGKGIPRLPFAVTTITATRASSTTASVSWSGASAAGQPITGYNVYYNDGTTTSYVSVSSGTSSTTLSGLTRATPYTIWVTTVSSIGESALSTQLSIAASTVPSAPTIGTVYYTGTAGTLYVPFTASSDDGGATISRYTTIGTGGISGFVSGSGSGTITVTGVPTTLTIVTFVVYATNANGNSSNSSTSNNMTGRGSVGQAIPSTGTYTVPSSVYSISIVAVGAGGISNYYGGGGGALGYINNYSVTPGQVLNIVAGSPSTTSAGGASSVTYGSSPSVTNILTVYGGASAYGGGTVTGASGFVAGGSGGPGRGSTNSTGNPVSAYYYQGGGGGGAAGYSGAGGAGGLGTNGDFSGGTAGSGGGGGGGGGPNWNSPFLTYGGSGSNGGGVGLQGQGSNGTAGGGVPVPGQSAGGPGSGGGYGWGAGGIGGYVIVGAPGSSLPPGNAPGGPGGVRIVYPGSLRSFPSTSVGDL